MLSIDSLLTIQEHLPGYVHHWLYTENGLPIMAVARYHGEGGKTYRQFHLEDDAWVQGMPSSPYPLYGLDSLHHQGPINAVLITEGEKSAALLHQIGWSCVTAVLGAQNPDKSDWLPLRHFTRFIILRDNDKAGIGFVRAVTRELRRVCTACEIMVVNLAPNLPGGDLIDWAQATVLLGAKWDGYSTVSLEARQRLAEALDQELKVNMISVEECPDVAYRPEEALFEGEPKPLTRELSSVPPFPLQVFPAPVRSFLELTSAKFSQVPDFAATTFIAMVAGLIGRSVLLNMRPGDFWQETTNCWAILVGPPSSKKSPIMRRILGFLKPLEDKAGKEHLGNMRGYQARKRTAENSKQDFDEPAPIRRRYVTDDSTMPKLRELMAHSPRGVMMRSDELKAQFERLDRSGSEGDRSFMMSCWSGLEVYSEDRMCRESLINIPLSLTWVGGIPPPSLKRYLREAMGQGSGADGFMQRFQLVTFPNSMHLFELSNDPFPPQMREQIGAILSLLDEAGLGSQRELAFHAEAQPHFDAWLTHKENEARSGGHPIYWESHLGKQAKVIAVLAIVLHRLSEVVDAVCGSEISLTTLTSAIILQEYFEAHAKRCYESVEGGAIEDAKTILRLVKEKRVPTRFKAQDIYHMGLGGLDDSSRVGAALDLLQGHNWVALERVQGKIGRSSEFWVVYPSLS